MSATLAQIGYGFILTHATTQAGTYTAIGAIAEIKPTKITVDKVEVKRNDSPDLYGEKIPGWKDGGEYDVKVVYDGAQYVILNGLIGVPTWWKFSRPVAAGQATAATTAFFGFISELGDEVPLKEYQSTEFKITLSGGQTYTVGS